jgi:hypothetical protein
MYVRFINVVFPLRPQIAQLRAELEKARALRQSSERVVGQLRDQLKRTANEKDILLRTTEIYEADKRELENEVYCDGIPPACVMHKARL